jgi:hypothetical protein
MSEENNNSELDFEGFLGADIEVEDRAFGSNYPLIQWVNGKPSAKGAGGIAYTGGWFLSADQGIAPPAGWDPCTLVTNEGAEIVGFSKVYLTFSPIRERRCWNVDTDGSLSQRFAWNDYESASAAGKPRGVAHVIAGVEGFDEDVLLSFRGMTAKEMMGQGTKRGIIPQYASKIVTSANRAAKKAGRKKTFPLCAFKLTVGPDRGDKGVPKFTEVGSGNNKSQITVPVWVDEPKGLVDNALLGRLFVGNELFARYQDTHRETDEWRAAWDADTLAARSGRGGAPTTPQAAAEVDGALPGSQSIPF